MNTTRGIQNRPKHGPEGNLGDTASRAIVKIHLIEVGKTMKELAAEVGISAIYLKRILSESFGSRRRDVRHRITKAVGKTIWPDLPFES